MRQLAARRGVLWLPLRALMTKGVPRVSRPLRSLALACPALQRIRACTVTARDEPQKPQQQRSPAVALYTVALPRHPRRREGRESRGARGRDSEAGGGVALVGERQYGQGAWGIDGAGCERQLARRVVERESARGRRRIQDRYTAVRHLTAANAKAWPRRTRRLRAFARPAALLAGKSAEGTIHSRD